MHRAKCIEPSALRFGVSSYVSKFSFLGRRGRTLIVDWACDPLRGAAWWRCENSRFFAISDLLRGSNSRFFAFLRCAGEPSAVQGSAWSRYKNLRIFAISDLPARPSAGIGVVEVQKLEVFCDFCLPVRPPGIGVVNRCFLRFLRCPRDPQRGSAWSRCKNSRFFAVLILRCADEPPAEIVTRSRCGAVRIRFCLGVPSSEIVRVEALSLWRRAILCYSRNGLWEVVLWFARLLSQSCGRGFDSPGSSKERLHSSAQAEHLAHRYKRRASCGEKLAQRAQNSLQTDVKPLARSSLQRATCVQQPGTMQLAQTLPSRLGAREIVAGVELWRCHCPNRGRRSCHCRNRHRRSILWQGQRLAAVYRDRMLSRARLVALWRCPCPNRGRRSALEMPSPKSWPKPWQAQQSVHLCVPLCAHSLIHSVTHPLTHSHSLTHSFTQSLIQCCLSGRGSVWQLFKKTGRCLAHSSGRAKKVAGVALWTALLLSDARER